MNAFSGIIMGGLQSGHKVTRTVMVCYPPAATGVNYNLVGPVEIKQGERLFWTVIHSPEGSFVCDYRIQRPRRLRCPQNGCHNLLEQGQRKCSACQASVRRERNRRYYKALKNAFKTVSP